MLPTWLRHPIQSAKRAWSAYKTTWRYTWMMSERARVGFRWRKEAVRHHLLNVVKEIYHGGLDTPHAIVVETSVHGIWITTFAVQHEAEILADGELEDRHQSVCYPTWGSDGTFIFLTENRQVRLPGTLRRMYYDVDQPIEETFVRWNPRERAFIEECLAFEQEKEKAIGVVAT